MNCLSFRLHFNHNKHLTLKAWWFDIFKSFLKMWSWVFEDCILMLLIYFHIINIINILPEKISDTHIYKRPIGVHFLNTCIPMLNLPFIFVIQYLCWNLHYTQKHSPLHLESVYCLYPAFYCHKVSYSLMTNYLHDFITEM